MARILLVDDDIAEITAVKRLVARTGHRAQLATTAADASGAIERDPPDLLVVAARCDAGQAVSVIHEAAADGATSPIPAIVLGDAPGLPPRVQSVALPIDPEQLGREIERLLATSAVAPAEATPRAAAPSATTKVTTHGPVASLAPAAGVAPSTGVLPTPAVALTPAVTPRPAAEPPPAAAPEARPRAYAGAAEALRARASELRGTAAPARRGMEPRRAPPASPVDPEARDARAGGRRRGARVEVEARRGDGAEDPRGWADELAGPGAELGAEDPEAPDPGADRSALTDRAAAEVRRAAAQAAAEKAAERRAAPEPRPRADEEARRRAEAEEEERLRAAIASARAELEVMRRRQAPAHPSVPAPGAPGPRAPAPSRPTPAVPELVAPERAFPADRESTADPAPSELAASAPSEVGTSAPDDSTPERRSSAPRRAAPTDDSRAPPAPAPTTAEAEPSLAASPRRVTPAPVSPVSPPAASSTAEAAASVPEPATRRVTPAPVSSEPLSPAPATAETAPSLAAPPPRRVTPPPVSSIPPPPEELRAGTLAELAAPRLLALAAQVRLAGRLDVEGDVARSLWFEGGRVVGATSADAAERIEALAVRLGLVTRDQHQQVAAQVASLPARRAALLLLDAGFLKPAELGGLVRRRTEEVVFGIFGDAGARFRWVADEVPADERAAVERSPLALAVEGVRRRWSAPRLDPLLGGPDTLLTGVPDGPPADALALSPEERQVAALADGLRTLHEIERASPLDALATRQVLAALVQVGALDVRRLAAPVAPEATRKIDLARLADKLDQARRCDYFTVLGLSRASTAHEVREAASRLEEALEPGHLSGTAGETLSGIGELLQVIRDARDVLGDDRLRQAYLTALGD